MAKLTPTRNFLLRREDGVDVVAKRGEKIEVTPEEHKKFSSGYFREKYTTAKKK